MSSREGNGRAPVRHRSRLINAVNPTGADPKKQRAVRQEQGSRPNASAGADAAAVEAREAFLCRWNTSKLRRRWRRREELERTDVKETRPVLPRPPRNQDDDERERDRDRDRERDRDHGSALPATLGVPPATSAAGRRQSHRVRSLLLYRKSLLSVLDDNRRTFQGRAYWAAASVPSDPLIDSHESDPTSWAKELRTTPNRRAAVPMCSICSYWGDVTCTLCGDPVCGLDCLRRHQESHCEAAR